MSVLRSVASDVLSLNFQSVVSLGHPAVALALAVKCFGGLGLGLCHPIGDVDSGELLPSRIVSHPTFNVFDFDCRGLGGRG